MSSKATFWSGEVAQSGDDAVAIKYLSTAVGAILLYDYLLTFSDEVQFVWEREKKGWAFYLFLFNRYCPIVYEIWIRCVLEDFSKCESTIKIHGVFFLLFVLAGQVVMTARLHAISDHRRLILSVLGPLALAQMTVGLITVFSPNTLATIKAFANNPSAQVCFFAMGGGTGYAYIGLSLLFGVLLFLGVATAAYGPSRSFLISSHLLREVILETSTYFVVMAFSYVTMIMFQAIAPHALKVTPTVAITIISPVMVSRMVLSLAKSMALKQNCRWDMDHFTVDSMDSDLGLEPKIIQGYPNLSLVDIDGKEWP